MEDSREELALQVRELSQAVADLGERLVALETHAGLRRPVLPELTAAALDTGTPAAQAVIMSFGAGSVAPLFGWAFLGIAGAYLLRSLTESGAVPGLVGAAAAIAYAGWWLFMASRHAADKPLFSTVHGLTAALILAPMLWEVTVRFHLFSGQAASGVLVMFAVWGLVIGWRNNATAIAWIGTLVALVTTSALFRETHDAATWVAATQLVALAIELSACGDRWLGLRWVVAVIADLFTLALVFLVGSPAAMAVGGTLALATIYAGSTAYRTLARGLPIAWLEIVQLCVVFSVAIAAALRFDMGLAAGLLSIVVSLACYALSITNLKGRNFFAYSTFAILLMTAAGWLSLSGASLAALFPVMAATVIGNRHRSLRIHATAYLLLSAIAAHLPQLAWERMIHSGAQVTAQVPLAYWLSVGGALLCYRLAKAPLDSVVPAGIACLGCAGAAAGWIGAAPLRTALLTALAIGAGWCGRRWNRPELVWLVYPVLGLAGIKLLAEDFRQGRSITLFLSLILFGGALIALPRLLRARSVGVEDAPMARAATQH